MTEQIWLNRLIQISLPLLILIFLLTALSHFDYTTDDTYIYLQFAKNIVNGDGFSFNAGEPTYGTTSPLWTLIISLNGLTGFDLLTAAKSIDLLFASFSILIFFLLAQKVIANPIISLLATIAFSFNAWFLRWSGTGMETSISIFITLLVIYYCLQNQHIISIAFAAILILIRPETFILAILVFINIFLNVKPVTKAIKKIFNASIIFLIITLPWFLYAKLTLGTFVPNTALAKATLGININDFTWTITDLIKTILITETLTSVLFFAGLFFIIINRKKITTLNNINIPDSGINWLRNNFVPISWVIFLCGLYIITQANIISRYLLLIIPVIIIYSFFFLSMFVQYFKLDKILFPAIFIFTLVIMFQNQFIYHKYIKPSIHAFTQGMEECFIPIGVWLKTNTEKTDIIMVPDIGAIGYYSDRKICDAAGLVSPEMLKFIREGFLYEDVMNNKLYNSVCNADYVVHRSNTPDEYDIPELKPLFHKVVFGLGLSDMKTVYYTVYKVIKNNARE